MNRKKYYSIVLFLIFLFIGSYTLASTLPEKEIDNLKNMKPSEGKSLVYFYRTSSLGFAVGLEVLVNNVSLDKFYPKKYYLCVLDSGKYVFSAISENDEEIIFNVKPNRKYYFEVVPKMGNLYAQVELEKKDSIEGNKGVQKCKNIGSTDLIKPIHVRKNDEKVQTAQITQTSQNVINSESKLNSVVQTNQVSTPTEILKKNSLTIGVLQGGGSLVGVDYERLITDKFGIQVGAGFVGYGFGVNYHLKPSIRSSYFSLQYWHQGIGDSYTQSVIGPTYVFRGKKWFTAQIGLGFVLGRGPAYPSSLPEVPILLMYSIGAYIPL